MTIEKWIADRIDDDFVIYGDGRKLYDARMTRYEPAPFIMESMVIDVYSWNGVTVLEI